MKIVFFGLSITSAWGNGHATTYRSLLRELRQRGHEVVFWERDTPWYAENRDLPSPAFSRTHLYEKLSDLKRFSSDIFDADAIILGSYVPQGVELANWLLRNARSPVAFYDIDTPVTLTKLRRKDYEYLRPELIPRFDLYLSFTGGPTLDFLEQDYGARKAAALFCSVDPELYYPHASRKHWDLGYLGTYSEDRQPTLERMMLHPARQHPAKRFAVAGSLYPHTLVWPENVERFEHLPPQEHRAFYNAQKFALNVTRRDMICAGWSPSVRLFEAAACGTPIITDRWRGLDAFFSPGEEILIADSTEHVCSILRDLPEKERGAIGQRALARVLKQHTSAHRAEELERLLLPLQHPAVQKSLSTPAAMQTSLP